MLQWLKNHSTIIITILVVVSVSLFLYSCESKVSSLLQNGKRVNRQELQLELNQLIGLAEIRMLSLDRQDELRAFVVNNALILLQGQPFNPLGLITGIAGIYGIAQAGSNISRVVKTHSKKRKANNGTG